MKRNSRCGLLILGVVLVGATMLLQTDIDPKRDRIQQPIFGRQKTNLIFQLPGPYILASFTGMRETVAGLLWVRADEFFHEGNYEAIMPLVRIITWLDPHYLDVYETGAWHLDFNIVDSYERSDRRFIPPALALLEEGFRNNSDTFDIALDMGFTHYYLKMRDYEQAIVWLEKASKLPDLNPASAGSHQRYPFLVRRILAHAYEKAGDIESARKIWREVTAESRSLFKKYPNDSGLFHAKEVSTRNYGMMLWREKHRAYDTYPPVDMKFEAYWERKKPKVLAIWGRVNLIGRADYLKLNPKTPPELRPGSMRVRREAIQSGQWVDGARINIVFSDLGYKREKLKDFRWTVPKDVTIMVDSVRIAGGKFEALIDMSKDPQMYAFAKKKYRLTLTFDPREAPDFIQDRIGWHGEGITDKRYLDTKTIPGVRVIRREWTIDRKDVL